MEVQVIDYKLLSNAVDFSGTVPNVTGEERLTNFVIQKLSDEGNVACNDISTIGGIRAIHEHGFRPQNISVMGFDDIRGFL